MNRTVRVGKVEDQDRFRREDMLRLTPDERVRLVFEMQARFLGSGRQPLQRTVVVRSLRGDRGAPSRPVQGPA